MDYLREVQRLSICGLMSKDEVVMKGLAQELKRSAGVANITDSEVIQAVSSLIDDPIKDRSGSPVYVNIGHIKTRVDYYREQAARQSKDEGFRLMRENWKKDSGGVPAVWGLIDNYLSMREPKERDRQEILDAIRSEMLQYPNGSEMYRLWREAGITWKEVKV